MTLLAGLSVVLGCAELGKEVPPVRAAENDRGAPVRIAMAEPGPAENVNRPPTVLDDPTGKLGAFATECVTSRGTFMPATDGHGAPVASTIKMRVRFAGAQDSATAR